MPLALIFVAAIAVTLLLLAGNRVWIARSRHRIYLPVTELEARAHALPLSKSILSVGPRSRDGGDLHG